jgi:hypothetical protein
MEKFGTQCSNDTARNEKFIELYKASPTASQPAMSQQARHMLNQSNSQQMTA